DPVSLSGTFVDPGTADTHAFLLDFGDGTTAITLSATHVYADNGVFTATLTVTDKDGAVGNDSLVVTVANVAPVVNGGPDQTASEGSTVPLASPKFNDKGTADTHTATIDWDDGTAPAAVVVTETPTGAPGSTSGLTGTLSVGSHVYADNAVYT